MSTNKGIVPKVLYKFRDDSDRTENIIKNSQIWLSTPGQLNDPLECRIGEIPKDWETKTIRQLEQAQLMGIVARPPSFQPPRELLSLSERETKQWLKRLANLNHARKVKAMRALYAEHGIELSRPKNIFLDMHKRLSQVGIFSLSESWFNELMWSHYGGEHQGIALGFSCSDDCKLASPRHCLAVTYADKKPAFSAGFINEVEIMAPNSGVPNVQRVSFEDPVFRSAISTKTPAWAHEVEWRYVEEKHGLFDFPGILSEAVFGLKMSVERRKHYTELLSKHVQNDVALFEVVESANLTGFEIKGI